MQASDTGAQAGILVTGASGFLGRELLAQARAAGRAATGTHLTNATADVSLDVCDRAAVDDLMARVRPAAVVHTAYLQGGDRMREVNVDGAAHVAAAAALHGARLIHLSTDFVFDGELARPYREDDPPGPVNEYGASKLDGERAVLETHGDALVVRTSLIYAGAEPGPTERMVLDALAGRADVAFFEDELRSPVARGDLAAALMARKEDANDHNLPLLIWYGLIPIADADPTALATMAANCELPLTRKFIARRLAEDIENNSAPLNQLLELTAAQAEGFQTDIISGVAEGLTGWRKATKPAAWDALATKLGNSIN